VSASLFDEITGHEKSLEPLRRALASQRLHHSLLFHGPEGVGKRLAAFALAAALQCAEQTDQGCGTCASCRRVRQGYETNQLKDRTQVRAPAQHADVLFYPPRRRQIQMDQVQDLCRQAGYRPYEGRKRVFIVDPADRMNREASNALLKTLEEPPPAAVLILITAHPQGLLPTLRSRCQEVRFAPLPVAELAALLEGRDHSSAEAERLARLAGGSVGRALHIDLDTEDRRREQLLALLESAGTGSELGRAMGLAEQVSSDAAGLEATLHTLAGVLRDLALLHQDAGGDALVHADVTRRLQPLAARFGGGAAAHLRRLEEARRRLRANVNPRLTAEAVLVGLVSAASR
jgi:DNA polymerase-3 subunit delta'